MRRALLLLLLPLAAPAQEIDAHWYTVQPGDSCWSIAHRLWGDGAQYDRIHKLNDLGPMPHLLRPGQKLRIPGRGVRPNARIDWLVRDVKAKPPRQPAGILFEDTSRLSLRENALLVIYGASAGKGRVRKRKSKIVLEEGTLRTGLAEMDEKPVEVETPAGKVKVAGREAQVEVGRDRAAHVSVYDGTAEVRNRRGAVEIPTDHGTVVKPKERPQKARPLPPAPTWTRRSLSAPVVVAPHERGSFEAAWNPAPRAARYRFELARDRAFRRPLTKAVVGAGILRFRAHDLSPGTWYARVSAIDRDRLEGHAGPPLEIRVIELATSRPLRRTRGTFEVAGWVGLDVPDNERANVWVGFGPGRFRRAAWPLRLFRPGPYTLRFRNAGTASDDEWESRLSLKVLELRGELHDTERTGRPGATIPIRLLVTDENGDPISPPDLALHAEGIGPLPLTEVAPGDWRTHVRIPATYPKPTLGLSAGWIGGELVRADLTIEDPYRERIYDRRTRPPAPRSNDAGLPPLPARGDTRLGIAVFSPSDRGRLRTGVVGEYGGDGFALTLDAFAEGELTALLGGRWIAIDEETLGLAAGLRIGLSDPFVIEPHLALDGDPNAQLRLGTHQSLPISTDFSDHRALAWASSYWLGWQPVRPFELLVEADVLVPIVDDDKAVALQLGGGIRFRWGPARLTLLGAGAPGDPSVDRFGAWRVGVTVDVAP